MHSYFANDDYKFTTFQFTEKSPIIVEKRRIYSER